MGDSAYFFFPYRCCHISEKIKTLTTHLRDCTTFSGPQSQSACSFLCFCVLVYKCWIFRSNKMKKKNPLKASFSLLKLSLNFFSSKRSWVSRLLRENTIFSGTHLLSKIYQTAPRKQKKQSKSGPSAAHRSMQRKEWRDPEVVKLCVCKCVCC